MEVHSIDHDDTTAALGFSTLKFNVVATNESWETRKNLAQAIGSLAGTLVDFRWMYVCI